MKKILVVLLLGLSASSLFAAPAQQQPSQAKVNSTIYHGYEGKKYVEDDSDSTKAYVTTSSAEKFRPFRVAIFVPGLFIGRFGATIDYKLNNAFAVGGLFRTWSSTGNMQSCSYDTNWNYVCHNINYKDYYNVYGLNMEYAVNGNLNSSGWILNPRLSEAKYRFHDGFEETDKDKINKAQSSTNVGLYLMHQWAWPTGIYMQLGVGATYASNPNSNIFSLSHSNFGGDWDFTLGYQF